MRRAPENRMISPGMIDNRGDGGRIDARRAGFADGYAISGGSFEHWLARGTSNEIIYAQGFSLPHGHIAVTLAAQAEQAGLVALTARLAMSAAHGAARGAAGSAGQIDRWWHFIAQRRRDMSGRGGLDGAGRVLRHLQQLAAAGAPGPSNDEIARACGLKDREAARYQLAKLARGGQIMIDDCGPRQRRIFTLTLPDGRQASTSGGAI